MTSIDIAAAPERVFRALTDPHELGEWWVGTGASTENVHQWRVDPRPHGEWSVTTHDALGRQTVVRGEYRVVDPPHVLEFTWQASWEGFITTTVRCELEAIVVSGRPGTRLRVIHTAARAAVAYAGAGFLTFDWNAALASLSRHASGFAALHTAVGILRNREIIA